jgi:phosphatidylethanolamine/phosphatidyl-N-methylethanolamine N-methyltransferase
MKPAAGQYATMKGDGMTLRVKVKERLGKKFDDEIRFFKGWMSNTRAVGSIIPTSSVTARRMASVIDSTSGLPVLELGPGTGVITKAILGTGLAPEKLTSVEFSIISASASTASISSTAMPSTSTGPSAICATRPSTASSPPCRC